MSVAVKICGVNSAQAARAVAEAQTADPKAALARILAEIGASA